MRGDLRFLALVVAAAFLGTSQGATAQTRGLNIEIKESEARDAPVAATVRLYGSSHALVIGIDKYTSGWPRLSKAVEDARAVAAALERKGFEVTLKKNLTAAELEGAFKEFFITKGADPKARLFVWYAGHGYSEDDEGFLIPADAPLPEASTQFRFKALPIRRFGEYVRLARSKHAYAVFDACFAGTIFTMQRSRPPAAITHATTMPVRQFLTSGDAGQKVSDDGTFRELFVRALRGEERADVNGDGYLTATEMRLFLDDRVTNLTEARQTPRYGKLRDKDYDLGDFVFALATGSGRVETAAVAPRLRVEEIEDDRVAIKNANLRAGPSARDAKVGLARRGATVHVTGKVVGRDWYRVSLADGTEGYVFGRLLGEGPEQAAVTPPPPPQAPKASDPSRVILPNGLRLSDWVLLAEDRLKAGEFRTLLVEGAGHRRAYGRRAGVEGVIGAAVAGFLKDAGAADAAAARETLRRVEQVKGVAGDSPRLAALEAKARHRLGQFAEAAAAYRRWLGAAPADHPERKQMALGLFKAGRGEAFGPSPGDVFKDCPECPEIVVVPAGSFTMGSPPGEEGRGDDEGPVHRVTIPRPFAVGKFEVTQGEWRAVMGTSPSRFKGERNPVEYVSWKEAKEFTRKLSAKTGKEYRLLSEAEWEYAARAGETSRYWWGDGIGTGNANCDGCGSRWDDKRTAPVGSFRANGFGLHDVHGNIWEWVEDCWHVSYSGAPTDGRAWTTGGDCSRHVLRGGAWFNVPSFVRSAVRFWNVTGLGLHFIGFRVARTF